MLTLFFAPGASSMAPHIALHEVDAAHELRAISLARREQDAPAFRALNPEGKVPTLLIDGRVLTEVAGILCYLARRFPASHLLPENDPEAEVQVVSWMSFIAATVHPARRQGEARLLEVFGYAEQRLDATGWAVGGYSIADIHLFRLYWRFVNAAQPMPERFPRLTAHFDRMMARPAVQRVIAIEQAIGYELPA